MRTIELDMEETMILREIVDMQIAILEKQLKEATVEDIEAGKTYKWKYQLNNYKGIQAMLY